MTQMNQMSYAHPSLSAANAGVSARMAFIRRTYLHLFGAILMFVLLEALLVGHERWVTDLHWQPAIRSREG